MTEEQYKTLKNIRKSLDSLVNKISDSPTEINDNVGAIRLWKTGSYSIGEVRLYNGAPYKCVQAHDSTGNDTWNPANTPSLWIQYHGTTLESARAWVQPTGAHDMYQTGEYMIFTDGNTYKCLSSTNYSPTEYARAWELIGGN